MILITDKELNFDLERGNNMKYYITYKVGGRYVAEVEATSLEEARKKAETAFSDANFGELSDIEGEDIIAEDESGDYIRER